MAGSTNTSDKSGLVRRQQRRRKGTLTFEKLSKVPVGSNVGFEQRIVKKRSQFQEEESVRRNALLVRKKGEGLRSGRFLRGISARMVSQTSRALGNILGENTHRA
jgi:hypothetical protein